MRLVFFGSSDFGLPTLESLCEAHEVVHIVTQPDRPAGRGAKLRPTPIAAWAREHPQQVPVLKPEDTNESPTLDELRGIGADAWVVIAFGQKLSPQLLDGVFAINLHASLLPRWRGAAPIHAAILAGDTETGNSVITLADRMDAGMILAQSATPISPSDTTGDLHDRLAQQGAQIVSWVLDAHQTGPIDEIAQDESGVTRARKLSSKDRWVCFSGPPEAARNRINALSPRPGVRVQFRDLTIKLLRSTVEMPEHENPNQEAGLITDPKLGLIACGQGGLLRILEVQPAGKKPMAWADFARGRHIEAGDCLIGA